MSQKLTAYYLCILSLICCQLLAHVMDTLLYDINHISSLTTFSQGEKKNLMQTEKPILFIPVPTDKTSLFGRPGPPGLKCTSAAAPTLQQTLACGLWGFN